MYREEEREPSVFLQSTSITCGVACTMMIVNYYMSTPLNTQWEGELVRKLKLERYDIVPAISLAAYMSQQGLVVRVKHQDDHKFWEFLRLRNEDMFLQQKAAFARARQHDIEFDFNPISINDILSEVAKGRLLIYGITLMGGIKHALLVYKYNDGLFYVIDPLAGTVTYTEHELMQAGDLDTGRWYISVGAGHP